MKLLHRVVRDNAIVNALGRRVVRRLVRAAPFTKELANRYRAYGDLQLEVKGARFCVHTEGDDHFANDLFYGIAHEGPELDLIHAHALSGGQFIDIGANTGIFSLIAAATNPALEVTSIEPAPSNARRLARNLSLNPNLKVRLVNAAVGREPGQLSFAVPADGSISTVASANLEFSGNFHQERYRTESVPVSPLDAVLSIKPVGPNDLIKIDVETYEREVLGGATQTLDAGPDVLIEVWDAKTLARAFPHLAGTVDDQHASEVEAIFAAHGYHAYGIDQAGVVPLRSICDQPDRVNYFFSRRELGPTSFQALFAASRNAAIG